jgi:hypothetical protein
MVVIERFEHLTAWQKARVLTASIDEVARMGAFAKDFGLSNQIQHAAVSVMSNIAEGFERGRRNALQAHAEEVTRILGGLCSSVERQQRPGLKRV